MDYVYMETSYLWPFFITITWWVMLLYVICNLKLVEFKIGIYYWW